MVDFCFPSQWFTTEDTGNNRPEIPRTLVRSAKTQDLRELSVLLTKCFHPSQGLMACFQPLISLGVYEDLRSRLRLPASQYCCLVASQPIGNNQNELVGTVEITQQSHFWQTTTHPYISNLAVKPSYRRRGIARQLLLKCEQVAQQWGYGQLTLHVLEDNHGAKELYLNSGYEIQNRESNLANWLLQQPHKLLLQKTLLPSL